MGEKYSKASSESMPIFQKQEITGITTRYYGGTCVPSSEWRDTGRPNLDWLPDKAPPHVPMYRRGKRGPDDIRTLGVLPLKGGGGGCV